MASLTNTQLSNLKERLMRRASELRAILHEESAQFANEQFSDLAGTTPDEGDQAVADMLIDVNNAVINSHVSELRDIQAALARIGEESYGLCADCGQDIGYPRLSAAITAVRCLTCQSQRERTYARDARLRL